MPTSRRSSDWPTPYEYDEALLNYQSAFSDPKIRGSRLLTTNSNKPARLNGGGNPYVCVYRLEDLIVRCFASDLLMNIFPPEDIVERYAGITAFLQRPDTILPFLVKNKWIEYGVSVRGTYFPYIEVPFVQNSKTLGDFLSTQYRQQLPLRTIAQNMGAIAQEWLRIIQQLENMNVAHGDLDPSNILVCGTYPSLSLHLIDFDGMYIPDFALKGMNVADGGHSNFQPVQRSIRTFGPTMDRFSALVIYLSLCALEMNPSLWTECEASESCLLLGEYDFDRLSQSKNFALLRRESHNRSLQVCLDALQSCIPNRVMPPPLGKIVNVYVPPQPLQPVPSTPLSFYEGLPLPLPLDQDIDVVAPLPPTPQYPPSPYVPSPTAYGAPPPPPYGTPPAPPSRRNTGRIVVIAVIIVIVIIAIALIAFFVTQHNQQQNSSTSVLQMMFPWSLANVADLIGEDDTQERQSDDKA